MGTFAGTHVFVQHGWRASFQILVILLRGPYCSRKRWFGYEGGLEARQRIVLEREKLRSGEGGNGEPKNSAL
ncbi:hypothetical protein BD769DRAFT_1460653 [Suillus cothurnatus]|nr:hypothetical protein BD769DRAFT_1460653 [Suillus cothurnatus]